MRIFENTIRQRLKLVFLALGIVPLIVMGVLITLLVFTVEKEHQIQLQHEISKRVLHEISSLTHELEAKLRMAVRINDLMGMERSDLLSVLSKVRSLKDIHNWDVMDDLALLDKKGRELARVSRIEVLLPEDYGSREDKEEFLIPMHMGRKHYSQVSIDKATGEPTMVLGIPIMQMSTGEVHGVLVARLRLNYIWDVVGDIKFGKSGIAYLIDEAGRVIAHSNPSLVLKGTFVDINAMDGIGPGINGRMALRENRRMELGDRVFYIVTEKSVMESFMPALATLATTGVFVMLVIAGAMALGVFVVRKIVVPIESLADTAKAISGGNMDRRAEITGGDEIATLAESFNTMSGNLVRTIDSLNMRMEEQARAEDEIRKQHTFLTSLLESLTHPFYVIDAYDYTVKMANSAAGFGPVLNGKKCHELTHLSKVPCHGEKHPCSITEIRKTKGPVVLEHVHYDSEGNPLIVEVHGYPIFDQAGNVTEIIEYTLDITDRRKGEEELRNVRHLESVGRLAAGIAHEINNPLANASLNMQLLLKKLSRHGSDETVIKRMESLGRNIDRASEIARELLQFSRLRVERAVYSDDIFTININATILDSLELTTIVLRGIDIRTDLSDVPEVAGDPMKFEQVMINLINNAAESMHGSGTISVSTSFDGALVHVEVMDTGSGVKEEHLSKLFDPFFTTKDVGEGTGLGLSICFGIISEMKGKIDIASLQGKGTSVKVSLPPEGKLSG